MASEASPLLVGGCEGAAVAGTGGGQGSCGGHGGPAECFRKERA